MSIPKEVLNKCPFISCYDHDDADDSFKFEDISFFKFTLKAYGDTPRERKENTQAIKRQMQLGILQPNGLPVGINLPKRAPVKLPNATPKVMGRAKAPQPPRQVLKSSVAQKIAQQVEKTNRAKLPKTTTLAKRIEQLSKQAPVKKQERVFLNKRK